MLTQLRSMLIGRELDVTLYSKPGCELCREAERVIDRVFGKRRVNVVNILDDRVLEDLYVFRIPVLVVDGIEVAEGLITGEQARGARQAAIGARAGR